MRHNTIVACLPLLMIGCIVRGMLYPAPDIHVPEAPAGLNEVQFAFEGKKKAVAWHNIDPKQKRPIVLFFHGNGENLATLHMGEVFSTFDRVGADIIALDYPGYGRSEGKPSEEANTKAAHLMLRWVHKHHGNRKLVVTGWSLGAAVAIQLAAKAPSDYQALILMSPWANLKDLAANYYPRWLVSMLLSDEYDSAGAAKNVDTPVLIMHGMQDGIIPFEHGKRMATSFPKQPRFIGLANTGHNDLFARPEVWSEIRTFLASL